MIDSDLPSFDEPIGLFPLPNVVLLPGGTLPLQVFEPRYRAMVRDALENESVIGMALLRPGYQALYHTNHAKIHPIVCVGRIREHLQIPDGRYFMNLAGLCRARVQEELGEGEYRSAILEPMIPADHAIAMDGEYEARDLLRRFVRSSEFDEVPDISECRDLVEGEMPLTHVVDRLAAELLPQEEVGIRQHLLEEMDVLRRTGTLLNELRVLHQKLDIRRARRDETGGPPISTN